MGRKGEIFAVFLAEIISGSRMLKLIKDDNLLLSLNEKTKFVY